MLSANNKARLKSGERNRLRPRMPTTILDDVVIRGGSVLEAIAHDWGGRPHLMLGALLTLGACALGCASARPVDFSYTTKDYSAKDYPYVYEAWTRHARLISEPGTVIEIWATLETWDFRQAYIAKYARVYDLTASEREALAKNQLERARSACEIHLTAQSTHDMWADLANRDSPWRISLLDGTGAELAPTSISSDKLPEIVEKAFFPNMTTIAHMKSFSRFFILRFEKPDNASPSFLGSASGRLILRLASPAGQVEVTWEAKVASPPGESG